FSRRLCYCATAPHAAAKGTLRELQRRPVCLSDCLSVCLVSCSEPRSPPLVWTGAISQLEPQGGDSLQVCKDSHSSKSCHLHVSYRSENMLLCSGNTRTFP
uniref:Uncharacterized protein n=1 Tax=Oryzias melastigma TaxID=30732 RepID=A0A3B3BN03_ORYME